VSDEEIMKCLYTKKGCPFNTNFDYFRAEADKDPELIKSGKHPYIGYVERVGNKPKNPITDAWWM
jgi:hypothetical protein